MRIEDLVFVGLNSRVSALERSSGLERRWLTAAFARDGLADCDVDELYPRVAELLARTDAIHPSTANGLPSGVMRFSRAATPSGSG